MHCCGCEHSEKGTNCLLSSKLLIVCFANPLFGHRYEADQQASPGSPSKLIILVCKNDKDVKQKLQHFGRAVGCFQERGDVD